MAVLKGDRSLAPKITDMEFTVAVSVLTEKVPRSSNQPVQPHNQNYLFVVSNDPKLNISVWNWNAGKVIASASVSRC